MDPSPKSSLLSTESSAGNNTSIVGSDDIPTVFVLIQPWFKAVLFIAFLTTFCIGTAGNLLVASVIIRRRRTKRVIHFLTLNLATSDLTVLLVYLPLQLYTINMQLKWELGKVSCRFFYIVNAFTINASICTLLAITRDRYYAICHPMMTHSRGIASIKCWIPIIWCISFILTVPLLFVVDIDGGYCAETKWPSLLLERTYWILLFGLQIVLPFICFVITYSIIIYRFGKTSILLEDKRKPGRATLKKRKQKRKMLKMAIMLTIVYLVCSLPQHVVFFVVTFNVLNQAPQAVYIFFTANFMMILNSAVNPIIYGSQSDEIKREMRKICPCYKHIELGFLLIRKKTSNSSSSAKTSLMKLNRTKLSMKNGRDTPREE